jgi:magnesium chelatase family protein
MRQRVFAARNLQQQRFAGQNGVYCNAQMSSRQLREYCQLEPAATEILHRSIERLGLSARAYNRILKIARTIADLERASSIDSRHLTEAVQYRRSASARM